jgi:hypothetical protein
MIHLLFFFTFACHMFTRDCAARKLVVDTPRSCLWRSGRRCKLTRHQLLLYAACALLPATLRDYCFQTGGC